MKRRKTARYLVVILSLVALSVVSPLMIRAVSAYIAGKIRGREALREINETGGETEEAQTVSGVYEITGNDEDDYTQLTMETEKETEPGNQRRLHAGAGHGQTSENSAGEMTVIEENTYDEPVFRTQEEEDAANRSTWQDMTEKLLSLSEAAARYRKDFNPVYDELKSGLMNAFISGREQIFYEDIADYCFGHYNTEHPIGMVRFDALVEDTQEKMTVILEFFTAQDLLEDTGIPDLAYCTYNKKTEAFIFFTNARR